MERLAVDIEAPYDPIEASIHVGRYALALPFAAKRGVLDAACGEGYGSWLLANAGATEVIGVDISSEAIGKARTTFRHDTLHFDTSPGESLAELLPAGHFDLIVSIETIEHVADPETFLHALRKVASPDAIFIITCPNDHWYYGDAGSNPHHLRRLTLEQLKTMTIPILGDQVQWLLGSATLGFAAVDIEQEQLVNPAQSRFTQVIPSRLTLRVPSGPVGPTPTNASYFIGIWNAPDTIDGAGAFQALSMDEYSKMMWTATSPSQLAALQAEVAAERREREIVGVQAAALRRENEIVSSQLLTLRAALNAEQNQAAEMTARIQELDEALAWHVARIQNLEAEPSRRLLRRALGRLLRRALGHNISASSPLARLASRLRRRRGSS